VHEEASPPGFFDRADPADDAEFYGPSRLVTHIDEGAVRAVGELYRELGLGGAVLDLMGSWVSQFLEAPTSPGWYVPGACSRRPSPSNDARAGRVDDREPLSEPSVGLGPAEAATV
jgi:hypothetical protein